MVAFRCFLILLVLNSSCQGGQSGGDRAQAGGRSTATKSNTEQQAGGETDTTEEADQSQSTAIELDADISCANGVIATSSDTKSTDLEKPDGFCNLAIGTLTCSPRDQSYPTFILRRSEKFVPQVGEVMDYDVEVLSYSDWVLNDESQCSTDTNENGKFLTFSGKGLRKDGQFIVALAPGDSCKNTEISSLTVCFGYPLTIPAGF